jgi:SPP1 family predicted phage head-tail adaptor
VTVRTNMKLGQLRNEAQLQTFVETADQLGQLVQDWDDAGTPIPCEIRTANGREQVNAEQLKRIVSHVVTMWYQPGLNESQRLIVEDRVFNITYIDDIDNRHIQIKVYCIEAGLPS